MAAKSRAKKSRTKARPNKRAPARRGTAKTTRRALRPAPSPRPSIPTDLDRRLRSLASKMDKTFDAILLQALCEFADAWEDHFRTMTALADDDRVQLAVKPES